MKTVINKQTYNLFLEVQHIEAKQLTLREHSFFRRGGWAGGIPMSMNVKSPGPPFIFGVKKCDPPVGSSKIL